MFNAENTAFIYNETNIFVESAVFYDPVYLKIVLI
jgi:hypothetical protein